MTKSLVSISTIQAVSVTATPDFADGKLAAIIASRLMQEHKETGPCKALAKCANCAGPFPANFKMTFCRSKVRRKNLDFHPSLSRLETPLILRLFSLQDTGLKTLDYRESSTRVEQIGP